MEKIYELLAGTNYGLCALACLFLTEKAAVIFLAIAILATAGMCVSEKR